MTTAERLNWHQRVDEAADRQHRPTSHLDISTHPPLQFTAANTCMSTLIMPARCHIIYSIPSNQVILGCPLISNQNEIIKLHSHTLLDTISVFAVIGMSCPNVSLLWCCCCAIQQHQSLCRLSLPLLSTATYKKQRRRHATPCADMYPAVRLVPTAHQCTHAVHCHTCLTYASFSGNFALLKIGIPDFPVTPALGNVHPNFGLSTLFNFRTEPIRTDRRTGDTRIAAYWATMAQTIDEGSTVPEWI